MESPLYGQAKKAQNAEKALREAMVAVLKHDPTGATVYIVAQEVVFDARPRGGLLAWRAESEGSPAPAAGFAIDRAVQRSTAQWEESPATASQYAISPDLDGTPARSLKRRRPSSPEPSPILSRSHRGAEVAAAATGGVRAQESRIDVGGRGIEPGADSRSQAGIH